jgi:hypothetical protein
MLVRFCSDHMKGSDNLEDVSIYGRMILKWLLKKQAETEWTGFIWRGIGSSGWLL